MPRQEQLEVVPVTLKTAREFVAMWHRHLDPPIAHKFSIGVVTPDAVLRGVAMVGRPIVPSYDDGRTLEVNRTATDGTPNANSALYASCWAAAKGLGYSRLITYTQAGESGSSLRGAGWRVVAQRPRRSPASGWSHPSRPRSDRAERMPRTLWEAI